MNTKNVAISFGEGFVLGSGLDALLWAASVYFPELAKPSPLVLPLYDQAGVHYDDLAVLGLSAITAGYGAYKKDAGLALKGIGMALGSFVISIVPFPGKPPEEVAATAVTPVAWRVYVD